MTNRIGCALAGALCLLAAPAQASNLTSPDTPVACTDFAGQIDALMAMTATSILGVARSGTTGEYVVTSTVAQINDAKASNAATVKVADGNITMRNGVAQSQQVKALVTFVPNAHGSVSVVVTKASGTPNSGPSGDATIHSITCSYFRRPGNPKWVTDAHATGDISKDKPVGFSVVNNPAALNKDTADWVFLTLIRGDTSMTGGTTDVKVMVGKNASTF